MERRKLGNTGLEVSMVGFGGIIVSHETPTDAERLVAHAIEKGVNFFDVAPMYGDGEEKLGPALARHRKDVLLTCKTYERTAEGARRDMESSFKKLRTDYFDLYQVHCLAEVGDVDLIFAEDGAMAAIVDAKKAGLVRHVGITCHNEEAALYALTKYDFETVMLPVNWALDLGIDFDRKLTAKCADEQIGLIAIKSLNHRKWLADEEQAYAKSWCKPIFGDDTLGKCAIKYALSKNPDTILPPGTFDLFCFVVDNLEECLKNPLNDVDLELLMANLPNDSEQFFKLSECRQKTFSNR